MDKYTTYGITYDLTLHALQGGGDITWSENIGLRLDGQCHFKSIKRHQLFDLMLEM